MSRLHESILSTIGDTPVVRLASFEPPGVRIYAKVESFNPGGSVKDRMALAVIEDAEQRGLLRPGQTVIEATSGNTGIGLAMVCARKGYPLVIVMAENFSVERRKLLRFLGARVVLTPAAAKGTGMMQKARELAEQNGWFLCRQFENEANADVHARTTAQEILRDFDGERIDWFVSGYGTGGTINGVARALKSARPDIRIAACEPDNAPLIAGRQPQARRPDGSPAESHPGFRPHLVQGWTPDFISRLTEDAMASGTIDEIVGVSGSDALTTARDLALREGVLAGLSSGATLAATIALAQRAAPGTTLLCMLPDTGERYLSTPLFEHISADMSDDEMAISRSSPSARFDIAPSPAPEPAAEAPAHDAEARAFVDAVLSDATQPVVMFALEWCEFCWSARKLLQAMGVPYRAVEIDSAAMQANDMGGRIRSDLKRRTGWSTIPQIFIGGDFLGGATDLSAAYRSRDLHARLARAGLTTADTGSLDPATFLPRWLQTRSA